MKPRVISATEFKAKCLALLDEVQESGETITVTKRGRAVATVGPPEKPKLKSSKGIWAGKIEIVGDIVNTDTADLWDCVRHQGE